MASRRLTWLFLIATVQVISTVAQCPTGPMTASSTAERFTSPNYPEKYDRNLNCGFQIVAAPSNVVHVSGVDVQLYGDTANCGDKIEFFDGANENAPLIKKVCGMDMVSVQSTGQLMYVRFTSDGSRESKGFVLKYWSSQSYSAVCAGSTVIPVTQNPVTLYLPHMSGNSPTNCQYQLMAPSSNDIVYIDLHQWNEPAAMACGRGSMQVYNGMGTTDVVKVIDACGPERPFWSVSSSGQYLTISLTFTNNPPANSMGFYVRAMSMPKSQTCDQVATMPIGPMSSYIWYPVLNSGGTPCAKTLLAPKTTARVTVMHNENTRQQTPCKSSPSSASNVPFMAYDGTTTMGSPRPEACMNGQPTFYSTGQDLTLSAATLTTPVLLKIASFDSYCNQGAPMEVMANNRTMGEMDIDDIQRNSDCVRRIKAPSANDVVHLMLKSTLSDRMDCVYIYDGMDTSAAEIGEMCGSFEETVSSTGQYLTFRVMASNTNTEGGISARYYSVIKNGNCPEEINILVKKEENTLTTPNFPMEYPLNAMCKWRFVSYRPDYVVVVEVVESDLPDDCSDMAYVNDGETHEQERLGEWCGNRKPVYRGSGQTLLVTFDADEKSMAGKKGFKFKYYADNKVRRELVEGTDVLTIAGVLTIILVAGGLIFITYRLCSRRREKRNALKADRQPITE